MILGSEGKGISSPVLKKCDDTFKIPLQGNIESLKLNVDLSETLRINKLCMHQMSKKIGYITNTLVNINIEDSKIKKTDFINYNFKNNKLKNKKNNSIIY